MREPSRWSFSQNAVPRQYFVVDSGRQGHLFLLAQPNGAFFPARSGAASPGGFFEVSAPFDLGFEYQLLDLTANEKSPRGQTSLAVQAGQPSVWQPNDIAPPEVPVTVWLDPAETGHSFTVWSQAPGGPERFVQVTAQRGSDSGTGVILADGSYRWLAARSAWIQSTVGYGMQFWLTRDADNAGSGTYQHAGQGYQGGHPATWSATSAFPSLPDSARNLQARTFHINGARYGHTFSVVHPDTYQVSVNLGGWGTVWAGDGLSMSYMEGSAQIDANQPGWYLYDETLQEACSTETTEIFDGWPDFPGAAQNTLSLTIFGWRSGHILKLRQFNAAAQEIRSFDFGTHGWDILPGSLWLEPSDSAPFEVPYFSITMPTDLILGSDPNDPGTNRGFLVEDQTVQDLSGFFPIVGLGSGAIDLSRWYTPPVEQPYSLSSTRFFHDLVIRCTNGEEYPLTDRATQGDISWGAWGDAWWNAWGFFTANGRHRDGFAHWLIDRSTGEVLPLGATSYIADWVSNDTPQNLVASTEGQDSIRITWAPVAGIEGPSSYQVWRKRADWGYWQSMGFSPNGDQAFTDAGVAFGVTYTYRVQTSYDQGRSLPSNEVSLANSDLTRDSDQDGIPDWWEFAVMNGSRFWGWVNGPPYLALYENGVDPLTVDIDEDGLPDWLEIQLGTSKDNPDSDYDGLSDKWELDHGTNPWIADSDGDGATDGEEAAAGTNPKSTASHPPVLRSVFRNVYYDFYDYPSDSQYPDHGTLDKTASWDPTLNTNEADAAISAPVALTTLSANLAQTAFPATLPALSATGELLTHAQSSVGLGPVVCPHAQITHRRYWLTVAPAATAPIERTFVIETRRTVNNDVKPPTVRTQTVTIPVGQTASAPFDIITALPVDPEQPVNHYEYMEETPLPVDIVPDFNRDGVIDDKDRGKVSDTEPWRWWINDDDDNGEEAHDDVPRGAGSANRDSANQTVDGSCDLLDFFPVYFDIKKLLEVLPPDQAEYRLVHTQAAVKFAYTDLTAGEAGNYFRDASVAEALKGAATIEVPAAGVALTADFLNKIKNEDGKGVLIFEGAAVSNNPSSVEPLKLEVRKGGQKIAEVKFPLKLDSVEKMYRWINLRDKANSGPVARPTDVTTEPPNRPDRLTTDKHFVFVHGYSVTETDAKGWNAEIFKRLYQSGMRAKFTAVTWRGDQGKITGTLAPSWLQGATPDYWENVTNAFLTSPHLATAANALSGTKLIAGHSLGNMVVSSAIKDHALSVSKYFMLDAAVALEAYDSSMQNKRAMSDYEWSSTLGGSYPDHLWSAYWGNQFPTNDGRNKLTWRERFGVLPSAINFYSSGEEVLDNWFAPPLLPLPGSLNAWNKQELLKGTFLGSLLTAARQGGWGFNTAWDKEDRTQPQNPDGTYPKVRRANNDVADITPVMVKIKPFFIPFADARLHDLAQGSAAANEYNVRAKTLAEGIPSLSFAAGRNAINGFDATDNRDLMDFRTKVNGTPVWPRGNNKNWLHSDIKEVAFRYNWAAYEEIINMGQLK